MRDGGGFGEKRILGRTGLMVSRLGMSAAYGIGAAALEKGYHEYGLNFFYWASFRARAMAQAVRNLARTGRAGMVVALQSYDHLGFWVRRSVERGLRTLGLDHVDLLMLGWFNRYPSRRIIDACLKLKAEGKIGHIGLSGHSRRFHGALLRRQDPVIEAQMVRYNAAHRGAEEEVFPLVPENNPPGIITYTATRWGFLLKPGKMPPGEAPLTAADCYRFALSHPKVDVCLIGPRNESQLDEDVRALSLGPLSPGEMERVRHIGDFVRKRGLLA